MTNLVTEKLLALAVEQTGMSRDAVLEAIAEPHWSIAAIGKHAWTRAVPDSIADLWDELHLEGRLLAFNMAAGFSPPDPPALEE
jgi:hypothetical protein